MGPDLDQSWTNESWWWVPTSLNGVAEKLVMQRGGPDRDLIKVQEVQTDDR